MEVYDAKNMPLSSNPKLRMAQERYAREKGIQIMPNGQTFNKN